MKENSKKNLYRLVLSAVFIALGTVLSMIKIYNPPLGGSVTLLSMVPVVMISCMYGVPWGLVTAFVYGLGQMFLSMGEVLGWGLTPLAAVLTLVIDYVLAYLVLGFAGLFAKKGTLGMILGAALAVFLRFLCHYTTGVFIFDIWLPESWDNVWIYSLVYNGAYMLPEIVITTVGATILFKTPVIKKMMRG